MTKTYLALAGSLSLVIGLGACQYLTGGLASNPVVAGTVASTVLSSSQIADLEAICQPALPGLTTLSAPNMPTSVSGTAVYGYSFCQTLLSSGVPPATADANSPSWLKYVIAAAKVAATVAGIVVTL